MQRIVLERHTFKEMARHHTVVPVFGHVLADTQTPVGAFLRTDPGPNAFLLESVEAGERWGRYSFLGGDAFGIVKAKDGDIHVSGAVPVTPDEGEGPLAYVRRLLREFKTPPIGGFGPLHGGAVGYLAYDCVRELEKLPDPPPDDLGLPDMALLLTRTFVVFDHFSQHAVIVTNVPMWDVDSLDAAYDDAVSRCEEMIEALARPLPAPAETREARGFSGAPGVSDEEYAGWVERAKEHVFAGDVFQVVPSRRFEAPLQGPLFGSYRMLRRMNPSPYMYFLRFGADDLHDDFEIAGSSPEPLVRVTGRKIETRPIAGTRWRGMTDEEDAALADELLTDEKERAEHVMLVDLARNDVGRVSEYGSVHVDELMSIERYSHVMHIVSNVTGILREDLEPFDALTACFPAGTVSGAPKVRAMEIIDSFEKTRRGPYAGVVGYFDFSGNVDTCITIRTIVATGGRAFVQAGAGVVADSDPRAEARETTNKAEGLLEAIGGAAAFADQPS